METGGATLAKMRTLHSAGTLLTQSTVWTATGTTLGIGQRGSGFCACQRAAIERAKPGSVSRNLLAERIGLRSGFSLARSTDSHAPRNETSKGRELMWAMIQLFFRLPSSPMWASGTTFSGC